MKDKHTPVPWEIWDNFHIATVVEAAIAKAKGKE